MKTKNTAWTADEELLLARAVKDKISAARLSVRLQRSESSVKRRMRELGLAGKKRGLRQEIRVKIDPAVQIMRWLEACRHRDLDGVMDFYADAAILECGCAGAAVYAGAEAIRQYWAPKLRSAGADAFSLADVHAGKGRFVLDYTSYEAKPVRMYLSFDGLGKILHSECGPRGCDLLAL